MLLIHSFVEDYQDLFNCLLANVDRMDVLKRSSSVVSSTNSDRTGNSSRPGRVLHCTHSDFDISLGWEGSPATPVLIMCKMFTNNRKS